MPTLVRGYLFTHCTTEILLNPVFEDLRTPKVPNTWAEFSTQFRNYHIPTGLMKIKKGFLSLKQGNMSVGEYGDKFIQLLRYAPDEVADDERKEKHFMEGLVGPLQYQLVSHTFPSF
jgi:hypothetical protein